MKQTIIALMFLLSSSCHSQVETKGSQEGIDVDVSEFLKVPNFTSPDLEKLAKLKIPYRQNNLYGICTYDFKIILQPQFEDIETPDPLFNFFKAKKNGRWSIYDFTGKKVIPIETSESYKIEHKMVFVGNDVAKRSDLNLYINEIKDPITHFFNFLKPSAVEYLYKYYYFSKTTKTPTRAWFKPDYRGLFSKDVYYNTKFTNSFQYGYIKVMDEHQKFTLLDREGDAMFESVLNCAAISPTKILLLGANGQCAIMDINEGWKTDYRFSQVRTTANHNILIGEVWEKGSDTNYYLIDSLGHITTLSALEDYNENYDAHRSNYSAEYSKIKKNGKYGLVRANGNEIFPPIYDLLFHQPDVDRGIVRIEKKYGYYEWSTGKELVPLKLNYLAGTFLPYESGACIEIKVNKDRYIVNSNLEIRYQSAKTPIINISNFRIGDAAIEVKEDFEKAKLPKVFPNYVMFKGENMVHIFQCDGKYIRSIMGFKYFKRNFQRTLEVPVRFVTESITNYGIAQFRDSQNASFWVRLKDGMIYRKD